MFFRGRRRVGKSSLPLQLAEQNRSRCFVFTGVLDEAPQETLLRFANAWDKFLDRPNLSRISSHIISWELIFETMISDLRARNQPTYLFFDEIQWIAKGRKGFIGLFKNAWLELERIEELRIVMCDSSNKFFADYSGGEEKILRGLVTHGDIWLNPLLPHEVARAYGTLKKILRRYSTKLTSW